MSPRTTGQAGASPRTTTTPALAPAVSTPRLANRPGDPAASTPVLEGAVVQHGRHLLADDPALQTPLAELVGYHRNPRRGNVREIARSLAANAQYRPVTVNVGTLTGRPNEVLAGNHTVAAARELGWERIAAVWVDVDEDHARRIVLADNRLAELAEYDTDDLSWHLQAASGDYEGTGWEPDVAAAMLDGGHYETSAVTGEAPDVDDGTAVSPEDDDPDDLVVPPLPPDPVTRPGDVWLLGPHRLICGDARDPDVVRTLTAGATIQVAFTSPPYASRRVYDESSGFRPIPPDRYVQWFAPIAANVAEHLSPDGSWFVNIKAGADGLDHDTYVLDLVLAHVREWGWHWSTEYCWRRNGMPKSVTRRFKNQFEPIYQFTRGPWKMRPDAVRHESKDAIAPLGPGAGQTSWADVTGDHPNRALHRTGRVYEGLAYPGNMLPPFQSERTGHTAAFPVGLPAWFLRAYTDPGDVVFDPFMGSGSTILAAHREGRLALGCELSPAYCDLIARRWQERTGVLPVLEASGQRFDFTADAPPLVPAGAIDRADQHDDVDDDELDEDGDAA